MNYQKILSLAALILSIAFVVHGYPNASAEPSTNLGSNPLVSAAGSSNGVLFTAPADQLIVVTDVIVTASGSASGFHSCSSSVSMSTSTGRTLAKFQVTSDTNSNEGSSHAGGGVAHSFAGGLPVMVNEEVSISISGSCTVNYVVAGRYTAL